MGSRVISFRLDDDKLALLQQQRVRGESDNQTAMRLLMDVLGVEVKQSSRHAVDIVDNIRIEIKESIADGDIKEAIASSYAGIMGQFNGLLEELQDLKNQLQELQLTPPAVPCSLFPTPDDQLPMTDDQLPITDDQLPITDDQPMTNDELPITDESDRNTQIIELLKIENIIEGELYSAESLEDDGIFDLISTNQKYLEELIGEKLTLKKDTADVNKLLKIMGYATERTTKDKKKYNRIKVPKLPE